MEGLKQWAGMEAWIWAMVNVGRVNGFPVRSRCWGESSWVVDDGDILVDGEMFEGGIVVVVVDLEEVDG